MRMRTSPGNLRRVFLGADHNEPTALYHSVSLPEEVVHDGVEKRLGLA
jgi:hypothetical protein